jgi:uncharacterized protein (TIGR03435 family)
LVATNATLGFLIAAAYGTAGPLAPFEMVGGPPWLTTARFDVNARAPRELALPFGPRPELFQMLRTLLAERFGLKVHREQRVVPLFELVAKNDWRPTPGMRPSDEARCEALAGQSARGSYPPPGPGGRPPLGLRVGIGAANGGCVTMASLASGLGRTADLERGVVDRTGLTGRFEIDLAWTADLNAPADPARPSIFTALDEIGLTLESTRGPGEVLMIDSASPPTPD